MKKKLIQAIETLKKNLSLDDSEKAVLTGLKEKVSALPEKESKDEFTLHPSLESKDVEAVLYSDGACRGNPGPGAYGLLVQSLGKKDYSDSESFEQTTNNKMEMLGVIKGLEYLLKNNTSKALVVTDSKYVINGMDSWVASWKSRGWKKADKKTPENVELWQELDSLRSRFSKIKFEWVKGHSGHPQNEFCDRIANEALDEAGH